MDYPRHARVIWITDLDFEIVPDLPDADLARFMIYSPAYHAAQKLWAERNRAAGTLPQHQNVELRPAAELVEDMNAGGPEQPTRRSPSH